MRDPCRAYVALAAVAILCAGTAFSQAVDGTIVGTVNDAIKLQLRLESLNVTNTPQFANPTTSFGSNFGFVTKTLSSGTGVNVLGVVQLGAKFTF